jgi:uncharacterized membrane protein YidH (DUF202 family)
MPVLLESAAMKSARTALTIVAGAVIVATLDAAAALAQTPVNPSITPVKNDSPLGPLGKLPSLAAILGALGGLLVIMVVIRYMRYAPRFARDEETKVVRADRVQLGRELPRRNVDISRAAPVVVAPPVVPVAAVAVPVGAQAPAPSAPAAPAPAAAATSPAPAAAATSPAPAAAATSPAPAGGGVASPPPSAPVAPATPPPAAAPTLAAAPAERQEVTMDQAVFDQTLKELLDAGTDRRVAEGRARRAGMMAAKKAAGEG